MAADRNAVIQRWVDEYNQRDGRWRVIADPSRDGWNIYLRRRDSPLVAVAWLDGETVELHQSEHRAPPQLADTLHHLVRLLADPEFLHGVISEAFVPASRLGDSNEGQMRYSEED